MTSVIRQDGDTYPVENPYRLCKQPSYSVLSYTWGRYEKRPRKPEHRRLKVNGVNWEIPPVDEAHFTVEDFQKIIEVLGRKHDFAWIDIACIHQEDPLLKLQEIGQQGKIFQQAETAFIWLCRTSTASLSCYSNSIQSMSDLFLDDIEEDFFKGADKRIPESIINIQDQESRLGHVLEDALAAITKLTQDSYFTSLWTLQESLYHQSAYVISSSGGLTVPHPLGFGNLEAACPMRDSPIIKKQVQAIMALMDKAGYDPSAFQTYSPHRSRISVRHRIATLEQDRVFAIMSVYGIQTRTSQDSSFKNPYLYSLAELEYAFTAIMNKISPALGQLFTHTVAPRKGQTWKITVDSKIVNDFQIWTIDWRKWTAHCTIHATEEGHAVFTGQTSSLSELQVIAKDLEFHILIDEYLIDEHTELAKVVSQSADSSLELSNSRLVTGINCTFGEGNIALLKLATMGASSERSLYFVILHKIQNGDKYERIGICHVWPQLDVEWREIEGELH